MYLALDYIISISDCMQLLLQREDPQVSNLPACTIVVLNISQHASVIVHWFGIIVDHLE